MIGALRSRLTTVLLAAVCGAPALSAQEKAPPKKPSKTEMPGMPGMNMGTGKQTPRRRKAAGKTGKDSSAGMAGMPGMAGMGHDSMAMSMPIPMPKGMPMIPGLVGLRPPVSPFLPGAGLNPRSLPAVRPTTTLRVKTGDTVDLTAGLVRRVVRGRPFAMYAFNGQVPGPMLRVAQGATITVRFHNRIELPSTVHWHGLRQDNRFDGVPDLTQPAVVPGGDFTYQVHFPDAGIYWYHPHVREDIEQAMGLFGNMLVDSPEPNYYSPVNREASLVLNDLLVNADSLIPFGKEATDFALMGRVGNLLTVNGEPSFRMAARRGEVVRFYFTNVSNSRTYNISFSGAPLKVVASDVSRFEREERVPSVVLAPAERYVIEARFDRPGRYALVNSIQAINHYAGEFEPQTDTLGIVTVSATAARPDYRAAFEQLHEYPAVSRDIDRFRREFDRPPDERLTLTVQTNTLPLATVQFMNVDTAYYAPVEWVDGMPDMNWLSTSKQVRWILREDATGHENMDINWHVRRGHVVKLRIFNDPKSFHPMQHPIHLHGQRMLVVSREGVRPGNMVWKDTVIIPVGSTVDLLIDASNPGAWMLHCHIAEHLGSDMMAVLHVDP
ncbi:MAG: multicopper oxidase family protein [Gemmatimonadaceae bacterium]